MSDMGDGGSSSRLRYLSGECDMAAVFFGRGCPSRMDCTGDGAAGVVSKLGVRGWDARVHDAMGVGREARANGTVDFRCGGDGAQQMRHSRFAKRAQSKGGVFAGSGKARLRDGFMAGRRKGRMTKCVAVEPDGRPAESLANM